MSYQNSAAEFRPELHTVVEQAMAADTQFIADLIMPIYGVDTATGEFMKIKRGKGQLLSKPGSNSSATDPLLRAPGTPYREVTRTEEKDSWSTKDRGLSEPIDHKLKQNVARFYDKEKSSAKLLMRAMRTSREARVAAQIMSTDTFGTAIDGNDTPYTSGNVASIDFPAHMDEAKARLTKRGEYANTLVLSDEMWRLVARSTKVRQFFFGDNGGNAMVTKELVAKQWGLDQILVGAASYDTTKVGGDSDDTKLNWIWSDNYFAVLNVQGGAPEMGGVGRTFTLDEMTGGQLFVVESKEDWDRRSTILRVREDNDSKIINELSGVLVRIQAD